MAQEIAQIAGLEAHLDDSLVIIYNPDNPQKSGGMIIKTRSIIFQCEKTVDAVACVGMKKREEKELSSNGIIGTWDYTTADGKRIKIEPGFISWFNSKRKILDTEAAKMTDEQIIQIVREEFQEKIILYTEKIAAQER